MYRLTRKAEAQREKLASMRRGREAARLAAPAIDYPVDLPSLRRRIVIESFDFGHEVHVLEFFKSDRIDCFRVVVDGKEWKRRIGLVGEHPKGNGLRAVKEVCGLLVGARAVQEVE